MLMHSGEFKYYTTLSDEKLVTTTIEAMGQCAMRIPEVTERCMLTLMHLLASKREVKLCAPFRVVTDWISSSLLSQLS